MIRFSTLATRSMNWGVTALVLALYAASLFAQQPASPEQSQQPQGRGQGRIAGPGGGRRGAAPQRDVTAPTGTASITGRVIATDTGRPLRRARVVIGGGGRPRAASTDEQGRYRISALPAGSYTISATKSGYVNGAFGQRRASGTGTPLELTDGQQAVNIDIRLARGGVVTGRVLDEEGEPLARAVVSVLRQQYVRGQKQLTPAGADQSDDRGQYRVFGLPPGDYFVSATASGMEQAVRQILGDPSGVQTSDSSGYAPTYYPGVTTAGDATRVKLAAAQEITGVDFQIQVVPFATVKGIVVGGSATVTLISDDGGGMGGFGGALAALAGRGGRGGPDPVGSGLRTTATRGDGSFSIPNVTPGKYTIVARADSGPNGSPRRAVQPLVVAGEEVNVALTPMPGVQLGGTITLEATGAPPASGFSGFRVTPVAVGASATIGPGGRGGRPGDAGPAGQFTITDVMPGVYMVRGSAPRGWTMKSVYLDGRDITDQPIEVKSESVPGLNVIFTDKISSIKGTVRDARGNPGGDVAVIVFPSDERLWLPQSRQIVSSRTDAAGSYYVSAVPPGEYLIVAVEEVEQGEWFDPSYLDQIRSRSTKIRIEEGDQRTLDLKVSSM
ncbi:MAG TPA: carboxypeptidase-like regulatory domain-containing protein [Vicinamibacterales bacterium]|nr:carboxypeptidase-like regulatory domain-containing protein [Vicinamibacterales bacterium]